ncbi:MAG: universal stress protein [Methylibium sp.]|uniref:universal stress protein n=1 Tax=Methylibium sp. TaxID=2067992 RepID=UPI00179AD556|nr:universal stress protein [Methylibium sp.]MBA2723668.1 universal stress protein [Methylibium sp.]MBA3589900.1 universal stress protein [Methylibium sp.]
MLKILVPVDGSSNSQHAVRHVLREFRSNPAMDIHLLNVQPPFSRHITQWVDRKAVNEVHAEASEKALRPIRQMLDQAGAPYAVHLAVGEKATSIAKAAQQLRCDHIVIGTARKNSLIRTVEGSVTNEVIELTTVPVVAIAGDPASKAERYGIPAGIAGSLAWLVVAAAN